MTNCSISGTTYSIYNGTSTSNAGATMLDGTVAGAGFTCVGVYDASFTLHSVPPASEGVREAAPCCRAQGACPCAIPKRTPSF
jgi:hypothetical protein